MTPARPSAHRVYFSDLPGIPAGSPLIITGDEANHAARVKRLRPGESITLFDARGTVADAQVLRAETGKRALIEVTVGTPHQIPPVTPRIEIWCPPPKGDRLDTMIDQLSQLGVTAWRPLRTARAERDAFRADKLERVAIEAAKQCGRAWALELGDWADFAGALEDPRAMVADATGEPANPATDDTVLLLGPEGGWTEDELARTRATGRRVCRVGMHVMRIETAAIAASACLLSQVPPIRVPQEGDES
jgi:16S rRNA (uracil1498-N3)-methyltransferase